MPVSLVAFLRRGEEEAARASRALLTTSTFAYGGRREREEERGLRDLGSRKPNDDERVAHAVLGRRPRVREEPVKPVKA